MRKNRIVAGMSMLMLGVSWAHAEGIQITSVGGLRHLAIAYVKDGKSSDWKERVRDEQYRVR